MREGGGRRDGGGGGGGGRGERGRREGVRTVFPGYRAQCHRKFWLTIENYLFHCHVIFRFDAKNGLETLVCFQYKKRRNY